MAEIYVPGAIDIMGSANQMMQFRNSQQAQQANALQMQYAAEDRARADEARKVAAGNALAARARAQKIAGVYEQGFNPGKTAVMGPGTVQGSTEPSFDYDKTALKLLQMNESGKAEDLYKMTEARRTAGVEYMEKDAKARVEALKAETETYNTALARVKSVLDQATSIDGVLHYVDVVDADEVLGPLALKTGGPIEARKEAIRKMAAPKEAGGGGMTVDEIVQRLKGVDGFTLAGMKIEMQQKEATLAKTEAETANVGKPTTPSSTENERLRAILQKGAEDPNFAATIEYAAAWNALFGEKIVEMPDPNDNSKIIFQRVRVPAPDIYPRPTFGQQSNALAPAPVAAQPTNALAMNAGGYGGAPMPTPQTSTAMQPIRTETGEGMLASVAAPSSARETFDLKQKETELGRPKVTVTVQKMMDSFNELDKLGAIVNDEKPINENFMAMLSGGVFADALPLINPKAATRRGVLKTLTETAISQIAAAAGLTAKQMDSNADVKRIRVMVSGPEEGFTIQAVRESLINLDAAFGTGTVKSAAPATVMPDNVKALINKYK